MRTRAGFHGPRATWPVIGACAILSVLGGPADAQRREREGREVVEAVCSACHVKGEHNAPRIGDANAWSSRASQGLSALSERAIRGIRDMPAHGGNAGVSDIEIERAIVFMVNQSGGNWIEPAGGATPAVVRSGETVVQTQCAKCHQSGAGGAPKIGDRAAWTPRLKRGLDALVASAVHGHGPMPARGGLPDLSDAEIRSAIVAMFNAGLPAVEPMPATVVAAQDSSARHQLVAGTDVYLGLLSAETLRARARSDKAAGAAMEVPSGKGYYHVNISLVDSTSHAPVTDARVTLHVSDGMTSEKKDLGLTAGDNTVSYGGFFRLASGSAYNLTAEVRRPGVPGAIEAKFQFRTP